MSDRLGAGATPIFTIGHSTRSIEALIAMLRENGVARLADIRRYPGSRKHPQFSKESLTASLSTEGIAYEHFVDLGGRRRPRPDSPNTVWRNDQFRGYADHMATPEFRRAVELLLAVSPVTAVLCAEAVPWRCHRNLLADELTRRGVDVIHILDAGVTRPHTMNPAARIEGEALIYPANDQLTL